MTSKERAFPVIRAGAWGNGCPKFVRWNVLNEEWAQRNHDQSLERLAECGGLDPTEILAIVQRRPWSNDIRLGHAINTIIHFAMRPDETAAPPYPQLVTDRLRQIANVIDSRPVLGHWPAMMASPDADFIRSLADALKERRPLVHPLLQQVETSCTCGHDGGGGSPPCPVHDVKAIAATQCGNPVMVNSEWYGPCTLPAGHEGDDGSGCRREVNGKAPR